YNIHLVPQRRYSDLVLGPAAAEARVVEASDAALPLDLEVVGHEHVSRQMREAMDPKGLRSKGRRDGVDDGEVAPELVELGDVLQDRKSTRLNSSHVN